MQDKERNDWIWLFSHYSQWIFYQRTDSIILPINQKSIVKWIIILTGWSISHWMQKSCSNRIWPASPANIILWRIISTSIYYARPIAGMDITPIGHLIYLHNKRNAKCMYGHLQLFLDELVRQFVEVGLFDMDIYDKYGILTSQEMQTNFYTAISKRKRPEQESFDFWLLGELKFARPNLQKSWCNSCALIVQNCTICGISAQFLYNPVIKYSTCVFLVFVL